MSSMDSHLTYRLATRMFENERADKAYSEKMGQIEEKSITNNKSGKARTYMNINGTTLNEKRSAKLGKLLSGHDDKTTFSEKEVSKLNKLSKQNYTAEQWASIDKEYTQDMAKYNKKRTQEAAENNKAGQKLNIDS